MEKQDDLFRDAAARSSDPGTSHVAAALVNTTRLETIVLTYLEHNPSTTHEIAAGTGLDLVSISPRIKPLVRKGLVEDSGELRKGPSGRKSIVWRKKACH